jgi:beta-glucosidase
MRSRREVRNAANAKRRHERWTGYFTPERAAEYTLFVQTGGGYRLWLDGKLRIDSSPLPQATLRQVHVALDARPHELRFEEAPGGEARQPFFRVGVLRDDAVDPYALELAERADAVVLGLGFEWEIETESSDRELALPPGQDRLVREVLRRNPNVVVVLTSGGAVDVSSWLAGVKGLVAGWFPGQEGGTALAQLLLGQANFSGRLPISWERRLEDNPSEQSYFYNDPGAPNRIVYREGLFSGYRGYLERGIRPLYASDVLGRLQWSAISPPPI